MSVEELQFFGASGIPPAPQIMTGKSSKWYTATKTSMAMRKTPLLIGDASSDGGFSIVMLVFGDVFERKIPMFLRISILRYRFYQQSNDLSKIEEGPLDSLQPNTFHPKILVPVRLEILLWTRSSTFSPGSQPHFFLDVGQPVYNDPTGGTVSYFRWWLTFRIVKPLGDAYWLLRIQQNKMYQLLGRFLALDFCFHNALDTRSFMDSWPSIARPFPQLQRWSAKETLCGLLAGVVPSPALPTLHGDRKKKPALVIGSLRDKGWDLPSFHFLSQKKPFFGMTDLQLVCFMKTVGHLPRDFRFVTPKSMKMFLGIPCKCPAKFTWNNYSVHPRCGESRWSNSIKPIDGSCDAIYFPGDIDDSRDSPQFFVGVFTIFFSTDNPSTLPLI